jgi:ligand-binding sensor domain-containing protein
MWVPAGGGILGYTETELLVDHASQTGITAAGARAVAFDADGNLWATFSDGVRMYPPGALTDPNAQPTKTVSLANATGIAIRGATIAVGSCSGATGGVSTFTRTDATPTAAATPISVGCVWGLSYDAGNNGKLWVVSKSGSKVYRFTSPTGSIDLAGVSLTDAYGIAVDGSGNAWVSSCSGNSVQQISAAGVVGSPIALTDFPCPGGLALDKQGTLWVLSAGAGNGNSGSLVSLNGGTPSPQLNSLTQVLFGGIAFDPAAATLPVHQ